MNTANINCPACIARRLHTKEEDREFHPLAGHGYTPETGWTSEAARIASEQEQALAASNVGQPDKK